MLDTNVILDVLLDREPFANDASHILSLVERSDITGFVCATTITTIYYLLSKALGAGDAGRHIKSLLALFTIAPVNRIVLEDALNAKFDDFEDAVIHESAFHAGAKYIVTRNIMDFRKSRLPVLAPGEFIVMRTSLER